MRLRALTGDAGLVGQSVRIVLRKQHDLASVDLDHGFTLKGNQQFALDDDW